MNNTKIKSVPLTKMKPMKETFDSQLLDKMSKRDLIKIVSQMQNLVKDWEDLFPENHRSKLLNKVGRECFAYIIHENWSKK